MRNDISIEIEMITWESCSIIEFKNYKIGAQLNNIKD